MIRRIFYISLGAALAIYVIRRLQRLTPQHLAHRAAGRAVGLAESFRDFADDVRAGMREREIELKHQLGLDEPQHEINEKDGR